MNQVATMQENAVISPDQFIQRAIESGSNVDVLERLFELKQRHDAIESKKAFTRAMQQFQSIKPVLTKSSKVKFSTIKGTTEYTFCALSDMEKALKDPLSRCGLTYRFENITTDSTFGIRCVVTHVYGHSEYTEMTAPRDDSGNKNAIQGIGSTSTYLMRYTLIAAFALTTADEDNDGQTSGDLPYMRLLKHNETVRERLLEIQALKDFLSGEDLEDACEIVYGWPEDVREALWIAPTKGGIFTTQEIAMMKSDAWGKARAAVYARKAQ